LESGPIPVPADGEILARARYLSLDPYNERPGLTLGRPVVIPGGVSEGQVRWLDASLENRHHLSGDEDGGAGSFPKHRAVVAVTIANNVRFGAHEVPCGSEELVGQKID
jgi:hypothetical protein